MSKLYIRKRDGLWLNFVNSKDELMEFEYGLIPGRKLVLADLSTFNSTMKLMLLKILEEHPEEIDCYSSVDLLDSILLSRFTAIEKEPSAVADGYDEDGWKTAKRDYANAVQMQGDKSIDIKLRLPLVSASMEKFLLDL